MSNVEKCGGMKFNIINWELFDEKSVYTKCEIFNNNNNK